jgi:hypothetical protein
MKMLRLIWLSLLASILVGCNTSNFTMSGPGRNEIDPKYKGNLTAAIGPKIIRIADVSPFVVYVNDVPIGSVDCGVQPSLATSQDALAVFVLCAPTSGGSFWVVNSQDVLLGNRLFCDATPLAGYDSQSVRMTYLSSRSNCR